MSLRRPTRSLWLLALGLAPLLAQEELTPALPDLAPTIGKHLERDYYDHSRFVPKLMVMGLVLLMCLPMMGRALAAFMLEISARMIAR